MKGSLVALILGIGIAIVIPSVAHAYYVSLVSGHTYLLELRAEMNTSRWGGLTGNASGTAWDSPNHFGQVTVGEGIIDVLSLPGSNLITNDEEYYYAALPADVTINTSNILNTTEADLEQNQLFDQTNYPQFYPDYYGYSDNPKATFCKYGCDYRNISIGGVWFRGVYVNVKYGVPEILLKYRVDTSTIVPMYLVPISDYTGYDYSPTNMEMILPANKTYYLYILSKAPSYNLTVYIDGIQTLDIAQTALAYNVTAVARDIYSGALAPNITVAVFEENGNDIFLPYRLNGYVTQTVAMGQTDNNGRITFIVAPTEYPEITNYTIGVGIYQARDDTIVRKQYFHLQNFNEIVHQAKTIPGTLGDEVKVAVNAMNSLVNSLYIWASTLEQAYVYTLYYDKGTGDYYFTKNYGSTHYSNITLKTGAPNVISLVMRDNGNPSSGYILARELDGYLIMNPPYNSTVTGFKTHRARLRYIPDGNQFVITPTSYGDVHGTVTLSVYDDNLNLLKNITVGVDSSLEPRTGAIYQPMDALKTQVNAMNSVIYSLYYSLNPY